MAEAFTFTFTFADEDRDTAMIAIRIEDGGVGATGCCPT